MITFVSVFLYVQSERNEYSREDSSDQFSERSHHEREQPEPIAYHPGLRDIKTWTQSSDACPRNCSARNGLGLLLTTWDTFKFKVKKTTKTRKRPSVSDCCEQCKFLSRQLHLGSLFIQRNFHRFLLCIATTIFLYVD